MRTLRTLLLALVAWAALASAAVAKTSVTIDSAQATTHTYWYGNYKDPDFPGCSNTYDVNELLPDVTPPDPGRCGIYTATNGTFLGHLTAMPFSGSLTVSLNVKNPARTATASVQVNGTTIASQSIADNAVKTWIDLPAVNVSKGDDVTITVKAAYSGQSGWFELHSVHGSLGDAPVIYGKPNSAWNTLIPDNVVLDAGSDGANTELHSQLDVAAPYINTNKYSGPIYRATPDTPRVGVYVAQADGTQTNPIKQLQTILRAGVPDAMSGVPDPDAVGWTPPVSGDTDSQYAVYCADCVNADSSRHGYDWEFWRFNRCDPATALGAAGVAAGYEWCARWGGRDAGVAESPGHPVRDWQGYTYPAGPDPADTAQALKASKFEDPGWLASASSLPFTAGTVTVSDLTSGDGEIHHAVGMQIYKPVQSKWYWPAQRTDGWGTADGTDLYEGERIQVDPSIDCSVVMRTVIGAKICRAGQRYGWIIWDKSGSVAFHSEETVKALPDWDSSLAQYQQIDGIKNLTFRAVAPGTDAAPFVTSP
jgi:hypothetical protein